MRAEGERTEGRRDWQLHRAVFAVGVTPGCWCRRLAGDAPRERDRRGQPRVLRAGISHPSWLGVALGLLHALVLLSAFYLAYQRARGAELRDIESRDRQARSRAGNCGGSARRAGKASRAVARPHRRHSITEQSFVSSGSFATTSTRRPSTSPFSGANLLSRHKRSATGSLAARSAGYGARTG